MAKKDFNLAELARNLAADGVSKMNTIAVEDVQSIPLEKISANAGNFYEKSDIDELASSIELTGLIHPIVVKEDGQGGYTIIDGERRFTAMAQLGHETVPAIVRRPVNDVLEELMLIEANRTQRKMSAADIAVQAERYTELLAKLKESGVEIPGRLRDRVAEAMQISSAKLARLHAIMENLKEPYLGEFKSGAINESVAYELSKLTPERQKMVARRSAAKLTTSAISDRNSYAEICLEGRDCPFGGICDHGNKMYSTGLDRAWYNRCIADGWGRKGCCRICPDRIDCKNVCAKATPGVLQEQLKNAQEADAARADAEARALAQEKALAEDWGRLRRLREAAGIALDAAPLVTIDREYPALESRTIKNWRSTCNVSAALSNLQLIKLARLFECSVDELLGLGNPGLVLGMLWHPASEPVPETITGKVATWGVNGLSALKADEFAAFHKAWPEQYQWWAEVKGPEEVEV